MQKIFIADDHPLTLYGTKSFVESLGFQVVETAKDGLAALSVIKKIKPDFALLDINMPKMSGMEILEQIQDYKIPTKVIFLTTHNEMSIYRKAKELGVKGFILKNHAESELEPCLAAVIEGNEYVSPRLQDHLQIDKTYLKNEALRKLNYTEIKILELIAQQKTSKAIGELLFLSEKTVEGHRTNIISKLEIPQEKNALMKWALKML